MTDTSPTRSALLELRDERRAMHEGHVFLDEKCLLLAAEILRQLQQHAELQQRLLGQHRAALRTLRAAVARHGLQGLQVQASADLSGAVLQRQAGSLMGVPLQQAQWQTAVEGSPVLPVLLASPEARACRQAHAAVLATAAEAAAVAGNLERLSAEYRRALRRARALQDVLLPELDRQVAEVAVRLEELEQEDAIWMRRGPR